MAKKNDKERTLEFVFSDATRDSYGTVLSVDGWDLDRFNKNGIAFFNHTSYSSNPDMAIGTAKAWIDGDKLMGSITFEKKEENELADKVYRKFLNGTYKAVSVGFITTSKGKWGIGEEAADGTNPTYYYGRRELIEISCVPIPANKNALRRSFEKEASGDDEPNDDMLFSEGTIRGFEPINEPAVSDEEDEKPEDKTERNIQDDTTIIEAFDALSKSF
jgi:phage head maturation protease